MRFAWITAFAIVMVACLTTGASFWCFHNFGVHRMDDASGELAWLRQEFELSSQQLHRIEQMHAEYRAICEVHCRDIYEARQALDVALQNGSSDARVAQLRTQLMAVDRECVSSIKIHLKDVADIIGGDQGERYLAEVLPRVADFDHEGPVSLDLSTETGHDGHLGD